MSDDDGAVVAPEHKKSELRLPSLVDPAVAEQLVEQAQAGGVGLVGPDGLLGELTKQVLETGLEVEMEDHLGYDTHAVEGRDGGDTRNGTRSKTVITEIGPVEIDVPWDRDGSFESNCKELWIEGLTSGCDVLLGVGWVGGPFLEFPVDKHSPGSHEGDEVGGVDTAPAVLGGVEELVGHRQRGGA